MVKMETISNIALINAVKASQIRRNQAAKGERKRNFARDIYARYFSNLIKKDKNGLATRKL